MTLNRNRLWLVWCLVVFGAMNVFGPRIDAYRRADDPERIARQALYDRLPLADQLMTKLRDDGDIERYFSYAQATLGRRYYAQFVRPTGVADAGAAPDARGLVSPARPLAPWRDFEVEYPAGMMLAALAPALIASSEESYYLLFNLEMEAMLTLAVLLAVRLADRLKAGAGAGALAQSIVLTAALGVVAVRRYDPCVALAIAAAIHALAARRPGVSGVALALGVALKGAPLILAPIFVVYCVGRRDWTGLARGLAGGAATLGLAGLAYGAVAGPHTLDAFAFHASRPLQIETVYSGALILARGFFPGVMSEVFGYGSLNVASAAEPALRAVSTVGLGAGVVANWMYAKRRVAAASDDRERLLAVVMASLACLIAYITLGKVFSPQYCVWLIPLAAVAAPFSLKPARRLLPIGFLMIQAEYPFLYPFLYSTLTPLAGALIVARTFVLWRWIAESLRAPQPAPGSRSPTGAISLTPAHDREASHGIT